MNSSPISLRDKIEREVLNEIIDGLNSGSLSSIKAQEASKKALEALKKIDSHEESILNFYHELAQLDPVFEILYTKAKGEILMSREVSDYKKALNAINLGRIDEAHSIAKSSIAQTANETVNNS